MGNDVYKLYTPCAYECEPSLLYISVGFVVSMISSERWILCCKCLEHIDSHDAWLNSRSRAALDYNNILLTFTYDWGE